MQMIDNPKKKTTPIHFNVDKIHTDTVETNCQDRKQKKEKTDRRERTQIDSPKRLEKRKKKP